MTSFGYLLFYVLGMLPTYILPYFGSNSYMAQAIVAAASKSSMGLSWTILHAGALAVCVVAAWARGKTNGKSWLVALPIIAGLFDLMPVMNMVPMVPTILHVVALVVGFAAATTPVAEDSGPNARFVLLLLAGIVGASFVGAGANFGYATAKVAQQVKDEKEALAKRQEQERVAAETARTARAAAEAKKAAEAAEEQMKRQKEVDESTAKFKAIETTERAAYDAREQLLTPFSNTDIQARLNKYATELNKGNAAGAAAALGVEPVSVYAAAQDAVNAGGIVQAKITSFNVQPGVFNFKLKSSGYGSGQVPTGYDLESKNSALTVSVQLIGKKPTAPGWEKHTDVTTCISFNYGVQVDSQTGLAKFSATGYSVNRVCNKTN